MAKSPGSPSRGNLSPEGILREIQINLLECKVCFEKFSTQQREHRPQNLSCGHVLCLECITALSHPLLRKLECPFCRQLCSVDGTSHCQVLSDLQELLLSWSPTSSAPPHRAKGGLGLASTSLHLCTTFGGWGTLINPTGIAVLGSSGTIVVVHDGEKRVVVFSPQGKKLHSFGQRGRASGEICYPVDVAVTPCGYVVVTDAGNKAVKLFTSRGSHVLTVKKSFQMPWGVDTDSCGHILVSDVQAGTLSQVKVDFAHGLILEHLTAISDLQHPKAVACCRVTGNTAVMEHPPGDTYPPGRHTRLRVFTKDFQLLCQTDSFSLTLQSTVRLNMSVVAFDRDGDVTVIDSNQGMIWSLGKLQNGPALTPLVGDHLIRPVGLVSLNNAVVVLDSGDHTVKIYSAKSDAIGP
ncbi:E3 ubiquitin-protein ligase NHLRC1-like [Enoplosus armatus]|uniref:E3 ubiquitin-protein ligase NHLRC1-like n=1 Tax=Enoplosus armatus TaxID=215367 RepID=UPI0039963240